MTSHPADPIGPGLSFEPLTPTSFLDRAARSHGDRVAVIDGNLTLTYRQLHERCLRLAAGVRAIADGRPVAVLAPNVHELLEAHFAIPWAGVPLVAINTRLSAREVADILDHSSASLLVYHPDFEELVARALPGMTHPPTTVRTGTEYEQLIDRSAPARVEVLDERSLLSINYTSGTTGRPKGVMYHHRGAYLQALAMAAHTGLSPSTVHLWTLPMFHCNGWCFPWAVTAAGGTHICLPRVDAAEIWRLLIERGVTHFNGAPTLLSMVAHDRRATPLGRSVKVGTGGAPPTPAILRRMRKLGFEVTHLYGLTETFGPAVVCDWRPEWDDLHEEERARLVARQGVGNLVSSGVRVVDARGGDVAADGATTGEVALRGNNVMLGYYRDCEATAQAAPDGWFRTGDIAVMHPDGYLELRDRSKDVIISGGENIASIEVEQAIADHHAVLEVAVAGRPDEHWGETPVAYVTLREGAQATEREIIDHCRSRLAAYKAPRAVVFGPLPKTSTGKVQKFLLRERARTEAESAGESRRQRP